MGWKPADKIAVTLHNFKALRAQHLSVSVGDLLYILEELESGGRITGDWITGDYWRLLTCLLTVLCRVVQRVYVL